MKQSNLIMAINITCILLFVLSCDNGIPSELDHAYTSVSKSLSYNKDVRPILADRCFSCHGPDNNTRKAGLRLDDRANSTALLESGNGRALSPGNIEKSLLAQRIISHDPDFIMPPEDSRMVLTDKEKAILLRWIKEGAKYEEHWAFIPPKDNDLPDVPSDYSTINSIDNFVAENLSQNKLPQSPLADKERILRRLSLDLTGLPPDIQAIDDYMADNSENAYEKVVDRLLNSKAYGERMAMEWMDLARYADSHGLHADGYRMMWPWRDWVIDAFNENLSYNKFVSWQIAGDMLPEPTFEQKLATAFNRNHTMTAEGGAIDEEYRLSYVFDRTETFATAFLGLTVGCARCHDHKFDPISQKEYYKMTAFFNNVKELGMTGDDGNYGPMLAILSEDKAQELSEIKTNIQNQESQIELTKKKIRNLQNFIKVESIKENTKDRIFYGPVDNINGSTIDNNENFVNNSKPELVDGHIGKAALITGDYDELNIKNIENFEAHQAFSASMWINTSQKDSTLTQSLLCTAGNKNNFWRGWEFYLDGANRLNFKAINSLPHNYIHVRSKTPISIANWNQVAFTYDGTSKASGVHIYANGKEENVEYVFDQLYKSILPVGSGGHNIQKKKTIRVGKSYRAFTGENGNFIGKIDEIKIFNNELSPLDIAVINNPTNKEFSKDLLASHQITASNKYKQEKDKLRALVKAKLDTYDSIEEVMVMEEMDDPRKSFVYNRGEYTQATDQVSPGTPAILFDFPDDLPQNRLGLTEWLFSKENPLTARVTVNRYWQMIFGSGIVESSNDFGLQGSRPSNQKLLDHLAIELVNHDWDLKWLIKEMVMSYTYRQSSKLNKILEEKDPRNRLLARGPSFRMQAEMIRDNVLSASGILVDQKGGESVKPYQPEGLWIEKSSFSHALLTYKQNHGDSLYRRSLYTFVRRTSPHPAMTIFDAPNREVCTIKRENTSTPLQALVLLNDPQFVEAARVMAERIQTEGGESIKDQIQYAFRLTTGRKANENEIEILEDLYLSQLDYYTKNKSEAKEILSVGDFRFPEGVNESKTAALASVTSSIINHNEAYMKR